MHSPKPSCQLFSDWGLLFVALWHSFASVILSSCLKANDKAFAPARLDRDTTVVRKYVDHGGKANYPCIVFSSNREPKVNLGIWRRGVRSDRHPLAVAERRADMNALALGVTAKRSLSLAALLAVGVAVMAALQWRSELATPNRVGRAARPGCGGSEPVPRRDRGRRLRSICSGGKVVVLNLWAPWCAPCLKEMPSLDRLAARLPESDFAVVAVTKDPAGDLPSRRMFDSLGRSGCGSIWTPRANLRPKSAPSASLTTVILSQTGAPIAWTEGAADWDSPATIARAEALAGRTKRTEGYSAHIAISG